jgi:hypothetical protein
MADQEQEGKMGPDSPEFEEILRTDMKKVYPPVQPWPEVTATAKQAAQQAKLSMRRRRRSVFWRLRFRWWLIRRWYRQHTRL